MWTKGYHKIGCLEASKKVGHVKLETLFQRLRLIIRQERIGRLTMNIALIGSHEKGVIPTSSLTKY